MDWEEQTQIALFYWFRVNYGDYARFFHHSPNGGRRERSYANKLKAMGVQAGFPDIAIYWPTRYTSFLVVELKSSGEEGPKAKKGRVSDNQKEWLDHLGWCLAEVHVAYGFKEAKEIISDYMLRVIEYRAWCLAEAKKLNDKKETGHG